MGVLDKVKELFGSGKEAVSDHAPQVKDGVDKAADFADDRTGGKHTDKIDGAADKAKEGIDKLAGE